MLPLQGSLPSSNLGVPTNAEVLEWSKRIDSKSIDFVSIGGSNPSLRAIFQYSLAV